MLHLFAVSAAGWLSIILPMRPDPSYKEPVYFDPFLRPRRSSWLSRLKYRAYTWLEKGGEITFPLPRQKSD